MAGLRRVGQKRLDASICISNPAGRDRVEKDVLQSRDPPQVLRTIIPAIGIDVVDHMGFRWCTAMEAGGNNAMDRFGRDLHVTRVIAWRSKGPLPVVWPSPQVRPLLPTDCTVVADGVILPSVGAGSVLAILIK